MSGEYDEVDDGTVDDALGIILDDELIEKIANGQWVYPYGDVAVLLEEWVKYCNEND